MCTSKPDIPPPPPPVQASKQPELNAITRNRKAVTNGMGGTLLTAPSGVTGSALSTGAPTLLGG